MTIEDEDGNIPSCCKDTAVDEESQEEARQAEEEARQAEEERQARLRELAENANKANIEPPQLPPMFNWTAQE